MIVLLCLMHRHVLCLHDVLCNNNGTTGVIGFP